MATGTVKQVRRRDGSITPFRRERIVDAIAKALQEVGADGEKAEELAETVVAALSERFAKRPPGVEEIQDAVEETLMQAGLTQVAKAYILYRDRHQAIRHSKTALGVSDELKLSLSAVKVL
jgi:ribonucleoside-diphosphate reductase alpha chain